MTMLLVIVLVVVVISGWCIDVGRNVAIKHLKQDLVRRNKALDDTARNLDVANIEKDKAVKQFQHERKQLQDAVHEKDARVQKIVDENSHIQWRREQRQREAYNVTISINPEMFGGRGFQRDDLIYIARYLGDQVAHEFASYKFVEKARETEQEEYQARYRRPYTF